jgi:hypothetical protein
MAYGWFIRLASHLNSTTTTIESLWAVQCALLCEIMLEKNALQRLSMAHSPNSVLNSNIR